MKSTLIVICSMLLLTGCAAMGIDQRVEARSDVCYIKVTSTPSDAEVYINNMLVARTPAESIPIAIHYDYWVNPLALGGVSYGMKESFSVRVSKQGYDNAVEPIIFNDTGQTYVPAKAEYHFDLKKIE